MNINLQRKKGVSCILYEDALKIGKCPKPKKIDEIYLRFYIKESSILFIGKIILSPKMGMRSL